MIRLILRDPDPSIRQLQGVAIAAESIDRGCQFLTCLIDAASEVEAIDKLTTLGYDVWAKEYHNGGWVSIKLDASH